MNYYPKGGRCKACTKVNEDCSKLPFDKMPVHRRDGADIAVICTEFEQVNRNESMKADKRRHA